MRGGRVGKVLAWAALGVLWAVPGAAERGDASERPGIQRNFRAILQEKDARRRKPSALRETALAVESTRQVLRDLVFAITVGNDGAAEADLLEAAASQLEALVADQRAPGSGPFVGGSRLANLEQRCSRLVAEAQSIVAETDPAKRRELAVRLLGRLERPQPPDSGPTISVADLPKRSPR